MTRITPVSWQTLVKVFEAEGFEIDRQSGSHLVLIKAGIVRPVVIPQYAEIGPDIIQSNLRTAGISRARYFEILTAV